MKVTCRPILAALVLMALLARPVHAQDEHNQIVAVVNGDVVTQADVDHRGRLFALSTGMGISDNVLARLRPQVTRQLVDERLRLQEIQRRHIVVADQEIAQAIKEIETRNGLPTDGLHAKLNDQGVSYRTLIDQIRVQIGWSRVLRQELGGKTQIEDAEVEEQLKHLKAETGQPEYRISEIFIPIDSPANAADAHKFADTVISELRAGAAFPVVAAQFSQAQNALQGGDEGWLHGNEVDPAVAKVVSQMPMGAVSNPIPVPGGLQVVMLRARREVGRDMATVLSIRQVFLPFTQPLDPSNPSDQQKHQLELAHKIETSTHGCAEMEAANKAAGAARPSNPGDVRLEQVNPPAFRTMLQAMQPGQISKPLVAPDGIGLVMLCERGTRNLAEPSKDEIKERLLGDRIELVSRRLQRDLKRSGSVEIRSLSGSADKPS